MKFLSTIILGLIVLLGLSFSIAFFNIKPVDAPPSPIVYYKHIPCIVQKCDFNKRWIGFIYVYKSSITVYNKQYNLYGTFNLDGGNALDYEEIKKGDTVNCVMHTWRDNNGQIIKRQISYINR